MLAIAQGLLSANASDIDFFARTHIIEISQKNPLSSHARLLSQGSIELAGGGNINFNRWYQTNMFDIRLTWLTQMTPGWGAVWGLSTGERGPKYTIHPSLKLGFIYNKSMSSTSLLSVKASTVLAGRLQEKQCMADYGEIGGIQAVNCRMASSYLPPDETLLYLVNRLPPDRHQLTISYQKSF